MIKKVLQLILILISFFASAQQNYIELEEIVTDSAHIFTPNQFEHLKNKLIDFETKTTNQIVIFTIPQLGYDTIETYANGTFNQNGIGQKDKDNGILILFSNFDREVRIEVGYGLEPYITDAIASTIIRNTMIPNFKEERYFEGIDTAVDQIITFLNDPEALAEFKEELETDERRNKTIGIVFVAGFLLIFVVVGGFFFYKSYSSLIEIFRGIFIGKLGVISGLLMAIWSLFPSFFGLVFLTMPLVIFSSIYFSDFDVIQNLLIHPKKGIWVLIFFFGLAAIIALIKIKFFGKEDFKISWIKNEKSYMRKTFSSSGSHSFGSSGGSSSSFSGGGGSSGGGGASGSW